MARIIFIKRTILLFFVTFLIFNTCYPQQEYFDDRFNLPHFTENVTFNSPTVAAFAKYIDIPVSNYTGVPEISIPIYTITIGNFSLPINLSYQSSGIKVEEVASWVGLGWNLTAGGIITRAVKGLPDDRYSIMIQNECGTQTYTKNNVGYLYSGDIINEFYEGNYSLTDDQYWDLSHGGLDGEPDIFYFNFNNHTGKFVFDHLGNVHLFENNTSLKIEYEKTEHGPIDKFIIITDDGVKYTFESIETTSIYPGSKLALPDYLFATNFDWMEYIDQGGFTSSWFISEIQLPNTAEEILFDYENEYIFTLKRTRQERRPDITNTWHDYFYNCGYEIHSQRLYRIIWNNGKLIFEADHIRQDEDLNTTGEILYYAEQNTQDARALTKISLFDKANSLIRSYNFSYSYFISDEYMPEMSSPYYLEGYSKRLKLEQFYLEDNNGKENRPHVFEYNSIQLPHRFSYEQDYWGYYNSNYKNGLNFYRSLLPNLYYYPYDGGTNDIYNTKYLSPYSIFPRSVYSTFETHYNRADRNPNPNVIQACMLKKIYYPTGGSAEYLYEPNAFNLNGQNIIGGGVRVNRTILSDEVNHENDQISDYLYVESEDPTNSSGRIIYLPQYVKGVDGHWNEKYTMFSNSIGGLGSTHGSIVGYKEVKVIHNGRGMEYYKYNMPATFGEESADCSENDCIYNRTISESPNGENCLWYINNFPFPPDPNYDWNRGQLIEKKDYRGNILVRKIENHYTIQDYSIIPAVFVKDCYWVLWSSENCYYSYCYKYGKYYYLSGWTILNSTCETIYDENGQNGITTTTDYFYNNPEHKLVNEIRRMRSDETIESILNWYPNDVINPEEVFSTALVIDALISQNNLNTTLKRETFINSFRTSGNILTYLKDDDYNIVVPYKSYKLAGDDYLLKLKYLYDEHGNLIQYQKEHDITTTILWGNNYCSPIANLVNTSYDQAVSALNTLGYSIEDLQRKSEDELQEVFNVLRTSPEMTNVLISSYTYAPLYGVTSVTNPANITTYYQYDEFGRLIDVLDHEKYLTHHYEYNYQQCTLEVNPEDLFFDYSAGQQSVSINSNSFWNASESIDWIDIYPKNGHKNGSIQISCSENPSTEDRTAQIHVSCGGVIKAITVNQAAACYLEVDPDYVYFSQNASSELITVNSNTEWNVSVLVGDWISITNINDAGFTINCTENTGPYREGAVYISGTDCGNIIISIEQSGSY